MLKQCKPRFHFDKQGLKTGIENTCYRELKKEGKDKQEPPQKRAKIEKEEGTKEEPPPPSHYFITVVVFHMLGCLRFHILCHLLPARLAHQTSTCTLQHKSATGLDVM